ncbi:MAG: hypothetical protein WBC63_07495 [Candidatus Bipolaricaulia bacterium]
MKRVLVVLLLLSWAVCGFAAPHYAFRDLPEAVLLGDVGRTSIALEFSEGRFSGSIVGSLAPRLDVVANVSSLSLFEPEVRFLVVRDLLPLNVVIELNPQNVSLVSTLFLGPVHVDFGRTWGATSARWGFVQYAFHQSVSILVGLEEGDGHLGAILGFRIYPGRSRLWGLSFLLTRDGAKLTVGGTL